MLLITLCLFACYQQDVTDALAMETGWKAHRKIAGFIDNICWRVLYPCFPEAQLECSIATYMEVQEYHVSL